jgi:protein-tyrosine phosphatase
MRTYAVADWSQVRRLVFVCRGNICRSPYAERRALAMGLRASSFGLVTSDGGPPPGPAIAAAARRGIDMSRCRSRRIEDFAIEPGDLLIGMEPSHGTALAQRCPGAKVTLIGLWSIPKRPHLHDPFYTLADDYFDTCYGVIDSALATIQERMHRQ